MRRAALIAAVVLAGCGNERTRPPDVVTPAPPRGERTVALDAAGVSFEAPANWPELAAEPPLQGGVASRSAVVAVWRYPRTEPLPTNRAQLGRARRRLLERVELRDPTFQIATSELTTVDDARAIALTGTQTIAGLRYEVRSTHVFEAGAEIVVDAYAPPEHFDRVDSTVFVPLLESLKLEDTG